MGPHRQKGLGGTGCRWLERGWPIHHVHEMLGHSNLSRTSTNLLAAEMECWGSMRRFDAAREQPSTEPTTNRRDIVTSEEQEEPPPASK
jgi:hypothetical protein